tara:strand:- start:360 stop:1136 length:777 start_codon:yes stop_codon:yes gene_type:complete
MGYRNDGSVHYSGIKNEGKVVDFLKINPVYGMGEVIPRGGTKYKQDLEVNHGDETTLISVKKKTKLTKGSFDYINTTKIDEDLKKPFEELFSEIKILRNETEEKRNQIKESIRDRFNSISSETLDGLEGSVLLDFINTNVIEKNIDMKMWVVDSENKKHLLYDFISSPLYTLLENGYVPFIKQVNKIQTSRKIFFKKGDDVLDIGLRVRLVTNNGIGAMLGLSKSNKNSSLTLKIQQDKVHNLISEIKKEGNLVEYNF